MRQSDLKNLPDPEEEKVPTEFNFQESNKLFTKENESAENAGPAYQKDDFFDNLKDKSQKFVFCFFVIDRGGKINSRVDIETFGKKSIDEQRRDFQQRNQNRYSSVFFSCY